MVDIEKRVLKHNLCVDIFERIEVNPNQITNPDYIEYYGIDFNEFRFVFSDLQIAEVYFNFFLSDMKTHPSMTNPELFL